MSLRLKRNDPFLNRDCQGSALPVVLVFTAIGFIAVFSYMLHQLTFAKPLLHSPSSLQALLNARSGVYKGIEKYFANNDSFSDTLKTISTLDSMFGSNLIDIKDTSGFELGSEPELIDLFRSDSFGKSQISLSPQGIFFVMESIGEFRENRRKVQAILGSKVPALPDTVLILMNENPLEGQTPNGKIVQIKDTVSTGQSQLLSKLLSEYQSRLQIADTALYDPPLVIQSNSDLEKIPDVVNGPLFIDGSYMEIDWESDREITVMDDLQFTGEVTARGLSFTVGGEIRILDKSDIRESSMFSNSRIFIGDDARFKGDALAIQRITVYGRAEVMEKSTLVCTGGSSQQNKASTDSTSFSITLAEESKVDATCMALSSPGGIKTEKDVFVTGILWAQRTVCHLGTMKGLIRAAKVTDCEGNLQPLTGDTTAKAIEVNSIPGKLSPLDNITDYKMPFYSGLPSIIGWRED